jgi:hypothetical protein
MARPTKYSPKTVNKVYEFIKIREEEKKLPTIEGLAVYLNIDTDTIVEWVKEHSKFSVAIKKLKSIQADILQAGIYNNTGNVAGGIFLLKNNHGFRDRQEVDNTTNGQPLPQPIINVNVHPNDSNKKD